MSGRGRGQATAKDTAVHVLEEAQPPNRAELINFLKKPWSDGDSNWGNLRDPEIFSYGCVWK